LPFLQRHFPIHRGDLTLLNSCVLDLFRTFSTVEVVLHTNELVRQLLWAIDIAQLQFSLKSSSPLLSRALWFRMQSQASSRVHPCRIQIGVTRGSYSKYDQSSNKIVAVSPVNKDDSVVTGGIRETGRIRTGLTPIAILVCGPSSKPYSRISLFRRYTPDLYARRGRA
jgi:hypothetical protein